MSVAGLLLVNPDGLITVSPEGAPILGDVLDECCCGTGGEDPPPYWIYMRDVCADTDVCDPVTKTKFYRIDPRDMANAGETWEQYLNRLRAEGVSGCIVLSMLGTCMVFGSFDAGECIIGLTTSGHGADCISDIQQFHGYAGPVADPDADCPQCHDCCETGMHYSCADGMLHCHECGKEWTATERITATYTQMQLVLFGDDVICPPPQHQQFGRAQVALAWQTRCVPGDNPNDPGHTEQVNTQCQTESFEEYWSGYHSGNPPTCQYVSNSASSDCTGNAGYFNGQGCSGINDIYAALNDAANAGMLYLTNMDLRWVGAAAAALCGGSHRVEDVNGSAYETTWDVTFNGATADHFQIQQTQYLKCDNGSGVMVVCFVRTINLEVLVQRTFGPVCDPADGCRGQSPRPPGWNYVSRPAATEMVRAVPRGSVRFADELV